MLRCIKCGATIDGVAQYCGNCAEPAPTVGGGSAAVATAATCPSCGSALPQEGAFCPYCSARVDVQYAGFWMRFAASFVDGIILIIAGLAVQLVVGAQMGSLVNIAVGACYTIGFWVAQGATPGKMAMGIRVVKANGEPLDFGAAVARYLGYFVSIITLGVGYLMIAFTKEKRGLHDYIAGTVVVHGGRQVPGGS